LGAGYIKKPDNIYENGFNFPEGRDEPGSFPWIKNTRRISYITSIIIIIFSLIILVGWFFRIPLFMGEVLGSLSTKFNTALGFLVIGVILYLLNTRGENNNIRYLGMICGIAIILFGLLTFFQYIFNFNLPTDQLFSLLSSNTTPSSRIRFLSSLNFVLFGLALFLFARDKFISFAQFLCFVAGIIGYMGFLTYLFGLGDMEQPTIFSTMAFYTSLLHMLAATSFLSLCPEKGLVSIVESDSSGGYLARHILPLSAVFLTLIAFLSVLGEEIGIYHDNYGEIVLTSLVIIFFTTVIVWAAHKLNILDLQQKSAAKKIISMERFFENILEGIVDGVMVLDSQNRVSYLNPGMLKMLSLPRDMHKLELEDDVVSRALPDLLPYYQDARRELRPIKIDSMPLYRNKERRCLSGWIIPQIVDGKFKGAILSTADITVIKEAENVLESSLREKELLLGEIHHRVKNNLQIISSLLNLQSDQLTGKNVKDVLLDSQNRVKTMALVHENLYRSEDFSQIHMADYINNLAMGLWSTYQSYNGIPIRMDFDCEDIQLGIDTAIPLGLIINELVTNSLKHAFSGRDQGTITIQLRQKNQGYVLVVADDGVGMDNQDWEAGPTLGMKLVSGLVRQLDGQMEIENQNGTRISIHFQQIEYPSRI